MVEYSSSATWQPHLIPCFDLSPKVIAPGVQFDPPLPSFISVLDPFFCAPDYGNHFHQSAPALTEHPRRRGEK
ncbi:hypothetical protein TNCT_164501 [Trichonephila clavata]|uniref:Uncharacterized protein n=1 Tax=Trichonephila clavata TaxID=2740835 RepID=A0A8X6K844_TRICU|nr:hypothetical protein TNCT_164501 [Trichonephila clavata]